MDISQKRFELENKIETLLDEFTEETGYTVQRLKLDREMNLENNVKMKYTITTEVCL